MNKSKKARMQELVELLNKAGRAYYQNAEEIMSNYEYDRLYDELLKLEEELGLTLSNSPTANVGYEVLSELPKERHERPMLSLDKTKDVEELKRFVGDQKALMSWKMDGLTIVLTYREGRLFKAVTRGNGEVGEVVTNNARVFKNIPLQIAYQGQLILRGEAVIGYKDFEKINEEIEDVDARYKNPRNLCSGSVRQLNNEITAKRNVKFYAFSLVEAEGVDFYNSRARQMNWLIEQGFEVVEFQEVTRDTVEAEVLKFSEKIAQNDFPSDGLVLVYDDIAYGQSLGRTSKFPRDSFAFKWADELRETRLLEIEWSPSRTGLINPVAIFEPVELEGTTVSRASVHNISIMEELELGVGDTIEVYKANMIIPQIARNLTRSGVKDIPKNCPVCRGRTEVRQVSNAKALYCINPDCQAKHVKSFALFVSRDALNIEGLSEATLEKFISMGYIREYADIFHLDRYREEIQTMEGFGEKSYQNLIDSIEGRKTYANMIKYIKMTASSNFGNMFSVLAASALLPFLPMMSVHLIFLNLIYDLSCTAIPWDNVDEEFISKPRKWDASSVGSFMIWIGPTSSIFDFTTYIFMYFVFCPLFVSNGVLFNDLPAHFSGAELAKLQAQYIGMFQAGWFVESMWSQTLVIHMIRTPKLPFIQSRASAPLTLLTMTGITVLTIIPFTVFGTMLGFVALPATYFAYLIPCILLYMILATSLKKAYVRHFGELL